MKKRKDGRYHLTLTSVVFEYCFFHHVQLNNFNLTLTSVVFELNFFLCL